MIFLSYRIKISFKKTLAIQKLKKFIIKITSKSFE